MRALWSALISYLRIPRRQASIALAVNSGLVSIAGVAFWAVAARLYAPNHVGENAALLAAVTLVSGISQMNLRPTLTRYTPVAGRATARLVAGSYLATALASTLCAVILISTGWLWGPPFDNLAHAPGLFMGFVLATILASIFALQDGVLVGTRASIWVPVENGAASVLRTLLLIPLALVGSAFGILASWIVSTAAAVVCVSVFIFKTAIPRHVAAVAHPKPFRIRDIGRFIAGDYMASLFGLAYMTLPPIFVVMQAGASAGAFFYVPWMMAVTLQVVARQTATAFTAEAAREPDRRIQHARDTWREIIVFGVLAAIGLAAAAPIALAVFGSDYLVGVPTLQLLAVALVPQCIVTYAIAVARIEARARTIISIELALFASIVPASFALASQAGGIGVATSWVIGHSLVAAVLLARGTIKFQQT